MKRLITITLLILVVQAAWGAVTKLPASHAKHVAAVEAAKKAEPSDPPWADRAGTIKHALTQKDGALVTLDAVHVGAIYKEPQKYLVIHDWYTNRETLIVDIPATSTMRPGQLVDVIGTLATLSDGRRVLECPTILGYQDKDGNLLVRGGPCIKGITAPVAWAYKSQLTKVEKAPEVNLTTTKSTVDDSLVRIKDLTTYNSVADLLGSSPEEGKWVRLRDRRVVSAGKDTSGSFIVIHDEGKTNKTVKVYTELVPKSRSSHIVRLIAKVHRVKDTITLEADCGPNIDPQIAVGSITIID
jgi:hypothetical protein